MVCAIVGGGVAGISAALTCRTCWPDKPVVLVDAEEEIGYYRSLLPQFMVGKLQEEKLFFWHPENDPLLTLRKGRKVESLDRDNQNLSLKGGERIEYERLILAHGGCADMPPLLVEQSCRGIFPIRDLTTARKIRQWISGHSDIVILGSSLVGVKTAVHLKQAGMKVSLVVRRDHTLLRALSPRAAQLVDSHLCQMGINIYFGHTIENVGVKNGSIHAVQVGTQWLPCDTLLVATGAAPDLSFLEGSGLLDQGEIVVSETLQTRDQKIFVAGDAATIRVKGGVKINPGTWPHAVSQGKLAARNLYQSGPAPLNILTWVNCMDLDGLSFVILGPPVSNAKALSYCKPLKGVLRELFIIDDCIVGGALLGDISGAGPLHAMMISNRKINRGEEDLLHPHGRALSRFSNSLRQKRQAFILSSQRISV
ncbi:MAG: FAD/NAD(P)-binding oxidoreductase [Thermodesulfobacteriota bacterium]|nr:FAD/NAD(P)-binding oxidoreductase [Thermodesulfobacteriota bacterium]